MQVSFISENVLVSQAQQGIAGAIDRLLRLCYPRLLRRARRLLRDDDVARDMVQDTLLSLSLNISTLRDPCAFHTWSERILRNRCISHIRRQRLEQCVAVDMEEIPSVAPGADPGDARTVVHVDLIEAIGLLGDRSREVVRLHYLLGFSIKEIAATVDASAGAIKLRLHRARIELRGRLAPEKAVPESTGAESPASRNRDSGSRNRDSRAAAQARSARPARHRRELRCWHADCFTACDSGSIE